MIRCKTEGSRAQ